MKKNTNKFLIILWFSLFIIAELLLIFNMTINVDGSNWYIYLIDFFLIGLIFLPVPIISMKFKISGKKLILGYVLEAFFAIGIFVSIAESTIDKEGTIRQVNNFIDFVTGKEKTDEAPKSFTIEILESKNEYKINDVISYKVIVDGKKSNTALAYEAKNELVKVNTVDKTIECLANGNEEIKFYSVIDNTVCYSIFITINSKVITSIEFQEESDDIFLDITQTYQLKKPIITPSDAEKVDYTYSSSNTKVAIVNENGLIEAIGYGEAVIKCKSGKISDSIYVCVGPNKKLNIKEDKASIYPEYDLYQTLHVYVDNVLSMDINKVKFSYKSKYEIIFFTGSFNSVDNFFTLGVYHENTKLNEKIDVEVEISYEYKGGTKISDTIIIELLPFDDITIDNIDLANTVLDIKQDVYYYNDELITRYLDGNISYKNLSRLNISNFKYECETLDVSNSVYDGLIVDLKNSKLDILTHVVKFYPSKNRDDCLEFNIELNKIVISEELADIDFEFDYLYSKDEGKKNEIYYKYFDKKLFTNVRFNKNYYQDTGLSIELAEESKEFVDITIDKLGIVRDLKLKKFGSKGVAQECELIFYVSSLFDSSVKKEYIINVRSQYDDILASIDNENFSDKLDVSVYENDQFELSFKYIMNLEYKGDYQTNFAPATNHLSITSEDKTIIEWNGYNIIALKKGTAVLMIGLLANIYSEPCTITVNITVDGPEDSISSITTKKELIDYNDNCPPDLAKGYCSVGTIFKIYVDDSDNYLYKSSDDSILKIENGVATCLKAGTVSIITQYKNDTTITENIKLNVYDVVLPFEPVQGDFNSLAKGDKKYTLNARVGQQYQLEFNITDETTSKTFKYTTKNKNIEISETGSVAVSKAGNYTITIQNGEDNSPYKQTITVVITATSTGFTSQFVYFIRKLAGHFAVFMFIAIFGLVATNITLLNRKNKLYDLFVLLIAIAFGFMLSVSTELIQRVTPGRYFHWGDVWINMSGYLTGACIVALVYLIKIGIRKLKNKG